MCTSKSEWDRWVVLECGDIKIILVNIIYKHLISIGYCSTNRIWGWTLSCPLDMIYPFLSYACLFLSHSSHMSFSSSPIPFPSLTFFVILSGRVCVGSRCMHERRRWKRQIYIVLFLCVWGCVIIFSPYDFVFDGQIKSLTSQTQRRFELFTLIYPKKVVFPITWFLLVTAQPMGFRGEWNIDSSSPF